MEPLLHAWLSNDDRLDRGIPLYTHPLPYEHTTHGVCDFCEEDDLDAPPHQCKLWPSTTPHRWVCAHHKGEEDASSSEGE